MNDIDIADLIAPVYYQQFNSILKNKYTFYWNSGGRSSAKSSFISLTIIYSMMLDYENGEKTHAIIFRKVGNTIAESVFTQLLWAIEVLGVSRYWASKKSPFELTYKPSNTKIYFRGLDEPSKIKSIKLVQGHFKYIWFEELAEFKNMQEIRETYLSLFRKNIAQIKPHFNVFLSYNPPQNPQHWVNTESKTQDKGFYKIHTTYLDIPNLWHTDAFLEEAERVKRNNFKAYEHQFLGVSNGADGLVYPMFARSRHVINGLDTNERVYAIYGGLDEGTTNDSTSLVLGMLTTSGRIITPPTFCYDPKLPSHQPLAHKDQSILILEYLRSILEVYNYKDNLGRLGNVVVYGDSAESCQQLMLCLNDMAMNYGLPFNFVSVGGKSREVDMLRVRGLLSLDNFYKIIDNGFTDPLTKRKAYELDIRIPNIDPLILQLESQIINPKDNLPMDGNDHSIDALKYLSKGLKIQGVI